MVDAVVIYKIDRPTITETPQAAHMAREELAKMGPVTRDEVLTRFRHDDGASVRGVLRDLTEAGVALSRGKIAVVNVALKD